MQLNKQQFIGVFESAFSDEFCDIVINFMDNAIDSNSTFSRKQIDNEIRTKKDDVSLFSNDMTGRPKTDELWMHWNQIVLPFSHEFWNSIYPKYADVYGILQEGTGQFALEDMKVQRTEVGGGYHVWHYEASSRVQAPRNLAWTLYLNDIEEGGETEFLYQSVRVKPKKGTFVLFPTGFTHTHRGNPPLSNVKYIMTGWTYLK